MHFENWSTFNVLSNFNNVYISTLSAIQTVHDKDADRFMGLLFYCQL